MTPLYSKLLLNCQMSRFDARYKYTHSKCLDKSISNANIGIDERISYKNKMKKIIPSRSEDLKSARLYLDDIKEIFEILFNSAENVTIETKNYMLDSMEDFTELHEEKIHDITLSSQEPYVTVKFSPSRISLYIGKDNNESRGIFEKIKKILIKCERPFTWILHNSVAYTLCTYLFFCLIGFSIAIKDAFLSVYFSLLFILCLLWAIYGWNDRFYHFSTIILKYRINYPSFIKRNKDRIIIALISAVVSAILTWILSLLIICKK